MNIKIPEQRSETAPPIAVVGVSALFAGSADAGGFWRDVLAGRDLITDVPASHWLPEDYYDPDPKAADKTYAKRGSFLDDIDFDPVAYGIPPSIVPATDTSQLLALIVARQVLDDATNGQFDQLDKSDVSVILGVTSAQELLGDMASRLQRPIWVKALREMGLPESRVQQACDRIAEHYVPWQESTFPGLLGNVVAGRIANRFDLGGTNSVTDAACASAFSALTMAVQELYLGHSKLVITGGVDTFSDIFMQMCFSKTPALSKSGDVRPFAENADGTLLGEGLGMVALKRLADAERDGDRVYAVLRGIGTSSDGRAKSVYAPLPAGQARALRRAYERAGYGPETVELMEAHGTGTKAGDAAEVAGLELVFGPAAEERRNETEIATEDQAPVSEPTPAPAPVPENDPRLEPSIEPWCALGSVKSQIGHTKAAAGAAGLFKVVMALHHKVLPGGIKIERPNAGLTSGESPFYLQVARDDASPRPWIRSSDHPRRASVSAFGFGGSNFHLTLEEYRGDNPAPRFRPVGSELVLLAADDKASLAQRCRELIEQAHAAVADGLSGEATPGERWLAWLAVTSQKDGSEIWPRQHRLALVCTSAADLITKLEHAADRLATGTLPDGPGIYSGQPSTGQLAEDQSPGRVAFLFPGQGSQRLDMGAELASVFDDAREVWDLAADVLPQLPRVVFPPPSFSAEERAEHEARLTATQWAQPALGAASLAQLAVLRRLGLEADWLAGHSFGEVTALAAAGVLSPADALRVARRRGELMRDAAEQRGREGGEAGAMLAVAAAPEQLATLLAQPEFASLSIANHNAPRQVVLSGPESAIHAIADRLRQEGVGVGQSGSQTENQPVKVKKLDVATAFHSPHVSDSSRPFADFLRGVEMRSAEIPVLANADARDYPAEPDAMRTRLAEQLSQPVRFAEQIERLYERGARTFIEVGPGRVLTQLVSKCLDSRPHLAVSLERKSERGLAGLWHALGRLAAAGHQLDFAALWQGFRQPENPLERERPRMTLSIRGSNYGSLYPPPGGAADLPAPNPEVATSEVPNPEVANPQLATPPLSTPQLPTPQLPTPQQAEEPAAASTPSRKSEIPPMSQPHQPSPTSTSPAMPNQPSQPQALPAQPVQQPRMAAGGDWMRVYQEAQRQMVDTHTAFQRTMADTQMAFLRTAEASFQNLTALLGGQPVPAQTMPAPTGTYQSMPAPTGTYQSMPAPTMPAQPAPGEPVPAQPVPVQPVPVQPVPSQPTVAPVEAQPVPPAATPPVPPAAPAQVSQPGLDVAQLVLDVVADKTGYPADMLSSEMDLEADLGIDSIKRVEILSALRERAPELPELEAAELGALHTLGQITERLGDVAVPAPAVVSPTTAAVPSTTAATPAMDVAQLVLDVVADKTGYPADMLSGEMDLEADLGIDSIKRVEILSALRERAPQLPELEAAELGALHTLGQITERLGAVQAPAPSNAAAPAVEEAASSRDLEPLVLDVVADKTGYPADMLSGEMDLEADLGIDSIKRVEILSALRERAPELPELEAAELGALHTLGQIIDRLGGGSPVEKAVPQDAPTSVPVSEPPAEQAAKEIAKEGAKPIVKETKLGRFVTRLQDSPTAGVAVAGLAAGPIALVDGGSGVAGALASELAECGLDVVVAEQPPASAASVIFLGGLADLDAARDADSIAYAAFDAARAFAQNRQSIAQAANNGTDAEEQEGVFVTVQDTGGAFLLDSVIDNAETDSAAADLDETSSARAWLSGLSGLAKTAAQEWPGVAVKVIDLERGDRSTDALAHVLADELLAGGAQTEVALSADGRRRVVVSTTEALPQQADTTWRPLNGNDVVVVSGGARGVTAACVLELAQRAPGLRLALLGRTPLEAEPAAASAVAGTGSDAEAALKRALLDDARSRGEMPTPAELGRRVSRLMAGREVRANLAALEAVGARPRYLPVDVQDTAAVAATLDELRRDWGPITGVIHAAGVLADKFIADKTPEQVERVYGTKVAGLRTLLDATAADPLRLLCLFSSVAGRCGNRGQADYAMANEVLNKVAQAEAARRRVSHPTGHLSGHLARQTGPECRVLAVGWGPWQGGMVTPELEAHFAEQGVPLIPLAEGARRLADELTRGSDVEVVIGGEPRLAPLVGAAVPRRWRLDVWLDAHRHGYLDDHRVAGAAVLPVAVVLRWFCHLAEVCCPNLVLAACQDVQVLRGVRLEDYDGHAERLRLNARLISNGPESRLALELTDAEGHPRYRATAEMAPRALPHPAAPPAPAGLESWDREPLYDGDVLFHGPAFQVLRQLDGVAIEGHDGLGMAARLTTEKDLGCCSSVRTSADPTVLDGALQMAVLAFERKLGGPSLPTAIGSWRLYGEAGRLAEPLHAVLHGRRATEDHLRCDVFLSTEDGRLVCELRSISMFRRPPVRGGDLPGEGTSEREGVQEAETPALVAAPADG